MNFKTNKLILLIFSVLFFTIGCSSKVDSLKDLSYLKEVEIPKPEEFFLSNGIKVFYIQDKEVPLVSASLYMPGGTLSWNEFSKATLEAVAELTRAGGTKSMTPEKLDLELLKLSAGISTGIKKDYTTASFSCLSSDIEKVLNLFMSVIIEPSFDSKKTELWKLKYKEVIKRRKDSPETIAKLTLRRALFGIDNSYGKTLNIDDIDKVTRIELLRAHRRLFIPERAVLAIKSNLSLETIKKLLDSSLSKWETLNREIKTSAKYIDYSKPGIYFAEKDLQQSTVYIGMPGPKRLAPDYSEIEIFNNIFGTSGFNSLLMQKLREDQGLVYGIYGAITSDVNVGLNIIAFQTKTESTVKAINESLKILDQMKQGDFTDENLKSAKLIIKNSYVFKYDSLGKLLQREVVKDLLDFPKDYDETYIEKAMNVTREDVVNVANKYWDYNKLAIIVVGNKEIKEEIKGLKLYGLEFKEVSFDTLPRF